MPLQEERKCLSPLDGIDGAEHYFTQQSEQYEEVITKPNVYEQMARGDVNPDHIYPETTN